VAQVAAAARANLLDTHHAVARVPDALDVRRSEGLKKLGQPVPESNLALDRNRGNPQNRHV